MLQNRIKKNPYVQVKQPSWHSDGDDHVTTSLLTLSRRCGTVENQSCADVGFRRCDNVALQRSLSRRCHKVPATMPQNLALDFQAILLQVILISFPSSKRERVTKVLISVKHTSPLFKRTLHLQLTKVQINQVKYMKFNLFTMKTIIHFFA